MKPSFSIILRCSDFFFLLPLARLRGISRLDSPGAGVTCKSKVSPSLSRMVWGPGQCVNSWPNPE